MKKKKQYFLFLLSVLIMNGCSKNDSSTPIDPNLKAAFNYQPGTYWIYKDSISGRVDSFFVSSNMFESNVGAGLGAGMADAININININIDDYTNGMINNDSIHWQLTLQQNNLFFGLIAPKLQSIIYDPLLQIPFTVTNSLQSYDGIDNFMLPNIYPSLTISGQTYKNVAEIIHTSNSTDSTTSGFYDDYFYVNEDVGIIKMNLHHFNSHLIWELQKNNIIK